MSDLAEEPLFRHSERSLRSEDLCPIARLLGHESLFSLGARDPLRGSYSVRDCAIHDRYFEDPPEMGRAMNSGVS
jgi:hypothetical protein